MAIALIQIQRMVGGAHPTGRKAINGLGSRWAAIGQSGLCPVYHFVGTRVFSG